MPSGDAAAGFRTAVERLAEEFQNESVASMVERLRADNLSVDADSVRPLGRGYTGARLVVVVTLRKIAKSTQPERCVLKLCPPGPFDRKSESQAHQAALDDAGEVFRDHLVGRRFSPIIQRDWVVTFQKFRLGQPLASLTNERQIEPCRTIRRALIGQWNDDNHETVDSRLSELVNRELRGSLGTGQWLHGWARAMALLDCPNMLVPGEDDPLPNPFHIFSPGSPYAGRVITHLVGRTHGDLHAGNILIAHRDEVPDPAAFRLIDLDTYENPAPLSRDIAALIMSLAMARVGAIGDGRILAALREYLLKDHHDDALAQQVPPELIKIVDVMRTIEEDFVREWEDAWHEQLKVSLLAQAMLHSAYESGIGDAPAWAMRLAGHLTRHLLGPDAPDPRGPVVEVPLVRQAVETESGIVDRDTHQVDLRAALLNDLISIVVIHGPAGVGKTALVEDVLTGVGWLGENATRRVCWREPALPTDVTIQTLITDIEGGVVAGMQHLHGPRLRARLEIALDAHRDEPVIVIDAAEILLDGDHRIRDAELDMALQSIASRRQSRVKVVIVTQTPLATQAEVTWPETARRIDLTGLEHRFLIDYLRQLDSDGRNSGCLPADDEALLQAHESLAGNPRLAELFHALIRRDTAPFDEIATWLRSIPPAQVRARVVRRLAGQLPADELLVLEALAAFGTPIPISAVTAVVQPELPSDRCDDAAKSLVRSRVVRQRQDGRLEIPAADIEPILSRIDRGDRYAEPGEHPTSLDLLHRAANEIYGYQKGYEDLHTLGDLDMYFAQLDLYLRARMYGPAHELIESIDEVLQDWSSAALLLRQREAVREHLGDDDEARMENLAALGDIYSSIGETAAADRAFEEAIAIAQRENDRGAICEIYLVMGYRYWEHDDIAEAREHFHRALALAEDEEDDRSRARALEGLADCDQQGGRYAEAFTKAEEALTIALANETDRVVDLALKLTRWRAECGELTRAAGRLTVADLATDAFEVSRRGEYLNGRADLLLYRGRQQDAVREAQRAVAEAEERSDPESFLQSLTTLAMAHLYLGDDASADQQITRAMRYWSSGHQLETPALRGLIAFRAVRSPLPGTSSLGWPARRRRASTLTNRIRGRGTTAVWPTASPWRAAGWTRPIRRGRLSGRPRQIRPS